MTTPSRNPEIEPRAPAGPSFEPRYLPPAGRRGWGATRGASLTWASITGGPLEALPRGEEPSGALGLARFVVEASLLLRRAATDLRYDKPSRASDQLLSTAPWVGEPTSYVDDGIRDCCAEVFENLRSLGARGSGPGWKRVSAVLGVFQTAVAGRLRELADGSSPWEMDVYRETMLRSAILCGAHLNLGPYLNPLILRSYPHYADFCKDHGLDRSQLHRVLNGRSAISLGRLVEILKRFHPSARSGTGPAYELRFVPERRSEQLCLAGLSDASEELPSEGRADEGELTLDEFCRRERDAARGGDPLPLPPASYDRSYALRVLQRKTPGSFRFFALLAFPRYGIVPRLFFPHRDHRVDGRECGIVFDLDWMS